jgi:hypothetical protein
VNPGALLSEFCSIFANANDNAIDVRVSKLPSSPENVLRALKYAGKA